MISRKKITYIFIAFIILLTGITTLFYCLFTSTYFLESTIIPQIEKQTGLNISYSSYEHSLIKSSIIFKEFKILKDINIIFKCNEVEVKYIPGEFFNKNLHIEKIIINDSELKLQREFINGFKPHINESDKTELNKLNTVNNHKIISKYNFEIAEIELNNAKVTFNTEKQNDINNLLFTLTSKNINIVNFGRNKILNLNCLCNKEFKELDTDYHLDNCQVHSEITLNENFLPVNIIYSAKGMDASGNINGIEFNPNNFDIEFELSVKKPKIKINSFTVKNNYHYENTLLSANGFIDTLTNNFDVNVKASPLGANLFNEVKTSYGQFSIKWRKLYFDGNINKYEDDIYLNINFDMQNAVFSRILTNITYDNNLSLAYGFKTRINYKLQNFKHGNNRVLNLTSLEPIQLKLNNKINFELKVSSVKLLFPAEFQKKDKK